jgi:mRNA deadenylase 3'-5' endonuclease subunit Ccr4
VVLVVLAVLVVLLVVVVVAAAPVMALTVVVVLALPLPQWNSGSSTGVRKMMMQTTAARHPTAAASNLRLCSIAPSRVVRKNALSKKNKAMLTGLFTASAYQNRASAGTRQPVAGY